MPLLIQASACRAEIWEICPEAVIWEICPESVIWAAEWELRRESK